MISVPNNQSPLFPLKFRVGLLTAPSGAGVEEVVKPLREGVEAAYQEDKDKYELIKYEIPDPEKILEVLNRAADEKVMLVIGPVLKSSVDRIATLPYLPLPVIAVNRAESSVNPELFMSIDLTREGEVEQLVQVAKENTANRQGGFAIFTTHKHYDDTLAQAIAEELKKDSISSDIHYVGKDQLSTLRKEISEGGYRGLFFAMDPPHASLIRPYLPADLPVFGTTYTNPTNLKDPMLAQTEANDLNGMVTLEIPAVTQMNGGMYMKYRPTLLHMDSEARRLFAVGVDVWNLGKEWIQWHHNIDIENGLSGKILFNKAESSRVKRVMDKSVVKPQGKEEFSFEEDAAEAGL